MGIFSARNERFLLYCMFAVVAIHVLHYSVVYYYYITSLWFPNSALKTLESKAALFEMVFAFLCAYYVRCAGYGRKASFDYIFLFFIFIYPLQFFYAAFRYKGLFKGIALIIFWITAFLVPFWTWYLVSTWTYWGYESS